MHSANCNGTFIFPLSQTFRCLLPRQELFTGRDGPPLTHWLGPRIHIQVYIGRGAILGTSPSRTLNCYTVCIPHRFLGRVDSSSQPCKLASCEICMPSHSMAHPQSKNNPQFFEVYFQGSIPQFGGRCIFDQIFHRPEGCCHLYFTIGGIF